MSGWTSSQLERIASSDELKITTPKRDGSLRRPIPIWVVRHGDALYVRSYRGDDAAWYRSVRAHRQAHISAGGVDTDVTLVDIANDDVNTEVDHAYREKYSRYGPRFLDPMVAQPARGTTLKLIPRTTNT